MSNEKEPKWLDDLNMARERIRMRAVELDRLSEAFKRTGNHFVADELDLHVRVLYECEGSLNSVSTVVSNLLLKQARENSANVLQATLAGIEIGERGKKDKP